MGKFINVRKTRYLEMRDTIKEKEFDLTQVEIVSCVMCSCDTLTDEEFELICEYVRRVYDRLDYTYIQLVSDIVCDLYKDLDYGYRDRKSGNYLTKRDLSLSSKTSMVLDLFYNGVGNY